MRLAAVIEQDWGKESFATRLREYAARTDEELQATAQLIAALYANMNNFDVFVALTLLYFAAASFAESARRLKKPELAESFLLCRHPKFGSACTSICKRALRRPTGDQSRQLIAEIFAVIEPFNVAGFGRPNRRNWYPVDAEDLLNAADKLGASRQEVRALLENCGFYDNSAATVSTLR
jgi:tetracycline 7-halogenase / FADH2 O2-dependent halogenase